MSLINKTFNHLTVTGVKRNSKNKKCYVCKCDCGNPKEILIPNKELLLTGRRKSCGCAKTNVLEKYNHLIDTQINKWHILGIKRINNVCFAECQCDCGTIQDINIYNLISGRSKDCGCGRKQGLSDIKSKNLVGETFGRLLVVEQLPDSNKFKRRMYRCKCSCGNEIIIAGNQLSIRGTESCGCLLSKNNAKIATLLTKLNISFKTEYSVNIKNHTYRFDFYLPAYNLFIEYDGEQHYFPVNFGRWSDSQLQENFKIIKTRDKIKTQYCESNNINLLRIPYWEQQNIDKIIINRLQRLSEKGSMNNFIEYATV